MSVANVSMNLCLFHVTNAWDSRKTGTGLEEGPVDNEHEAEEEQGDRVVESAVWIHYRQLVDPRLPGRDPEHADEGAIELEEALGRHHGEEVHPQDRVCRKPMCGHRW